MEKLKLALPELLSRLTIGYVFIESGIGKIKNLSGVISYFESLGIPFASIQAPFVSGLELVCGLFILFGFYTRLSSIPLIGVMVVALITAKSEDLTDFSSLIGTIEFLYIVILTWLTLFGSRFLSANALVDKILKKGT